MRRILQLGNHKLPKTTAIFNLPHVLTCPGATKYCKTVCYAKKAERMYNNSLPFRYRMLELSNSSNFVDIINDEIKKLNGKINAVRIHESGDFYSQEYLDKWIKIAKNNPNIIFYAYTRSYMFDYSKRPSNLIIRLSLDKTSDKNLVKLQDNFDGLTWIIDKNEQVPSNEFICPGSCKKCSYCLRTHGNVHFRLH